MTSITKTAIRLRVLRSFVRASALACLLFADTASAVPLTLNSGATVEILAVGPLQSTAGWTALMLKYRTTIPLAEAGRLRREVDEIWERFVVDVEGSGQQIALISANEPDSGGIVSATNSFNFVFQKRMGSWRTLEWSGGESGKLDVSRVSEFIGRIDWAHNHNNVNALLLYLADDWVGAGSAAGQTRSMNRMEFVRQHHAMLTAAKAYRQTRNILEIFVSADGTNARVESTETEEISIDNRSITATSRVTEFLAVQEGAIIVTRTEVVVEKQIETKIDL
jgi:hypothetical protein